MTGSAVTAPPWVRTVDLGSLTALVDIRTNRLDTLQGDAREIWAALAATGELSAAARLTDRPLKQIAELSNYLATRGLLTTVASPQPWPAPTRVRPRPASWGTREYAARLDPLPPVPWKWRARAAAALALTLAVQHTAGRHRRFTRLVALANIAGHRAKPARADHTRHAVNAVRFVAQLVPARVACLEESIAAAVTLAFTGQAATWCHGIAGDPLRLHAWLAIDGNPIEEPASTGEFTLVISVGPATRARRGTAWTSR